jgi:hypothetical protein
MVPSPPYHRPIVCVMGRRGYMMKPNVPLTRWYCRTERVTVPISYRIDPERNLVTTRAEGVVTDEDMVRYRSQLSSDVDFQAGMKILSDHRNVERHQITVEGIYRSMKVDETLEVKLKDCKQAIVTQSDLHFGMMRIYQMMMRDTFPKIEIFRDIAAAEAWLFSEEE